MDIESYMHSILVSNALRKPILQKMVRALDLPKGSRGLDAGCGVGLECLLLAEEVGQTGHTTGLDISADMLKKGRSIVEDAGLTGRISFVEGNVTKLPFDDDFFDWAWSCDCVGYGPWEPLPLLEELGRVIKPGGLLTIAAWSSEKLLPGHPRLEAQLGATRAGIAPFIQGKKPDLHFPRALGWFRELGFTELKAQVFANSVHAPLSNDIYDALVDLFDMRWPNVVTELEADVFAEYQRLCLPESPDFILSLTDYYAFFTYTMFSGVKPDTNH
jgi:ubiquinone/menaquinone biosynthesis C-methylase UbiE